MEKKKETANRKLRKEKREEGTKEGWTNFIPTRMELTFYFKNYICKKDKT